ncbi:MAG: LLM class F420-dependent oxidoreductase [Pseudomonadales bacterium]|nr:LLM class F420-dependent oxidoreductase [Pseudomonadales bacterium]
MKIGLFSTFMSPLASPDMVRNFAIQAEAAGVDSLWLGEHVVLFHEMEFPYPGSADGRIPVPEGGGLLDTTATFGFLAACTTKLRLGTGISLVPQRNPVYTAKEMATLDWLTGGRMDFGIGVGWCKEELQACGYTWEDRGKRCDEFLDVIQGFWTQEEVTYDGQFIRMNRARMDPKPVQPVLPTIVGGHSPVALRRAARYGQGWYGFNLSPKHVADMLPKIDAALTKAGRSRDGFEIVVTPFFKVSHDDVRAYKDMGVDRLILQLGSQKPDSISRKMDEVSELITIAS